jgi:hypothetical protein
MTPSQNQQVLAALRLRGSDGVTPLYALEHLGVFRLGARVWDLRKSGHLILNLWEKRNGKRYARYVLVAVPAQLRMDGDEEVIAEILV